MKKLFKTIVLIALTTAALLGGVLLFIHFYTGHGDELVEVPQVEEMRIDKAVRVLEDGGFDYEITDTVYRDGIKLSSIIDQNPEAGFKVKQGRKVYLVLNSNVIPDVDMPDLAGKASYNQALRILENRGLKVAKKIEMPMEEIKDPDSEPVIGQKYAGRDEDIAPGTRIKRNSSVDLVVGIMIDRDLEELEAELEGDEGETPKFPPDD
ncbi:MAG: PASTA domain-containing protein [Bacteroidia bacterium]|nr:PASTA domain-containing protein [Bacteroidia bacterium]